MANTPVKLNSSAGGKNNTLCCPDCDQVWNRCQCSTRRVDVSGSLMGRIESSSNPNAEEDSSDDLKGTIVASTYEIIECLGQGGMGGVYLTEHVTLRKKFALKILRKTLIDDDIVVERLRREAQACAMLSHQNLVSVFDFGITDNGFPFIVMEYIDGVDLTDVIDSEAGIDPARIVSLLIQICNGLEAAHEKGVVHRDLKPSNILVSRPATKNEAIRIVDFGIAKSELPGGEMQHLTQTGEVLGSPAYMSPEQIQGLKVDGRSDIYALGCILYEMLTKKQLFRGHTMFATLEANLTQHPPDFSTINDAPKSLEPLYNIMKRCLEKDREKRYQTVDEVRAEFEQYLPTKGQRQESSKAIITSVVLGSALVACIIAGVLFLEPKGTSDKTSSNSGSTASSDVGSQTKKSTTYEDLFEGVVFDYSKNDERAARKYKQVFNKSNDLNLRLASAVEFLDQRNDDLNKVSGHDRERRFEEITAVKNKAIHLIEKALREDDKSLNLIIAAQVYWEASDTMSQMANYYYSFYKRDCKKKKIEPQSWDAMSSKPGTMQSSYKNSVIAMKKGIQLLEKVPGKAINLAAYYGRRGRHLRHLGRIDEAIGCYKKAIAIEENSQDHREIESIISWQFSLFDLYFAKGDVVNARKPLIALDKKYKYSMSRDDKKKMRRRLKKLKSID